MKLPESTDPVKLINTELMDHVLSLAEKSPRKRTNFNFHPHLSDNPHRFLNVLLRGTYVAPHKHSHPPKAESFLVLRGTLAILLFHDDGSIKETHRLGESEKSIGIDIAPHIWHNLVVISESAVCFEVKPGPYDPTEDKQFAPWAPEEGQEGWQAYLEGLEKMVGL